jgi:hypothetical protein
VLFPVFWFRLFVALHTHTHTPLQPRFHCCFCLTQLCNMTSSPTTLPSPHINNESTSASRRRIPKKKARAVQELDARPEPSAVEQKTYAPRPSRRARSKSPSSAPMSRSRSRSRHQPRRRESPTRVYEVTKPNKLMCVRLVLFLSLCVCGFLKSRSHSQWSDTRSCHLLLSGTSGSESV